MIPNSLSLNNVVLEIRQETLLIIETESGSYAVFVGKLFQVSAHEWAIIIFCFNCW